nr:hypothetical protein [Tanacetum cinerariifolium]
MDVELAGTYEGRVWPVEVASTYGGIVGLVEQVAKGWEPAGPIGEIDYY